MPIGLREWFVNRLIKHLEAEKEAMQSSSSGNSQQLSAQNQPPRPPGMGIK